MKSNIAVGVSSLALIVGLASSTQAVAQELDQIVVTAQSRAQGLQDTPISITAVGAEKISDANIQKAQDLQFLVPNFTMTETGIATNVFIRGIGSGINQAFEQSVGTFIDGVHYPRAQQTRSPFLDLERIEVLRGPQSILFGKNAVAGALNITTAAPTDEFSGYLNGSYEFLDEEYVVEGAVSGPVSEGIRLRLAGRYRDAEGYMQNATLNRSEPAREDWVIRGTADFDFSDTLTARFKAEYGQFDVIGRNIEIVGEQPGGGGLTYSQILAGLFMADASVLNNTQDGIRSSNGDFSNNETQSYTLTFNWDLNGYELRSITAYQDLKYDELCDCDFTGAVLFNGLLQEEYNQLSQEIRLTSPVNDSYDFIAGLYYQTSDHDYADQTVVPANSVLVPALGASGAAVAGTQASRIATTDGDVYAAFAQFNYRPLSQLELQLGGRLSYEEKEGTRTMNITDLAFGALPAAQAGGAPIVYAGGFGITSTNLAAIAAGGSATAGALLAGLGELPVAGSLDETRFSPDIKLVYDATDDLLLYASWARGYKSGGFDFRANNRSVSPSLSASFQFDDERATNYEIGGKWTLADGAAEINFAGFFTKFDDLQISIFDGVLGFNVGNAASAEIMGLEIDGRWAATDYLTLSGSLAITDFEFTDFRNGQCYFGQTPDVDFDGNGTPELCDYTGNSNQLVSDFQGVLTADVHFPVGSNYEVSWVTDLFYTSEYDASATFDPALIQEGYAALDMRAAFGPQDGSWNLAVLAKNLTDEEFLQFGGDAPLAGSNFGAKTNYAFYAQGRTLWIQGRVKF